jgi:hypothetical protein
LAAIEHILAAAAAVCGFLAWIYLALGLTYAQFFEPEKKQEIML